MEKRETGKVKTSKLSQILKTFARCKSVRGDKKALEVPFAPMSKSRSWPRSASLKEDKNRSKKRVTPQGCFTVYVGPEKERFVLKTKCVNHPLFKMLLEEAEMEYGYSANGPLSLPCDVDLFHKILCEMDGDKIPQGCHFAKRYTAYHQLLSPSRLQ